MADDSTSSSQGELDSTIRENAAGPKWARGDSGEIEQHSLKDQIEADKYLRPQGGRLPQSGKGPGDAPGEPHDHAGDGVRASRPGLGNGAASAS